MSDYPARKNRLCDLLRATAGAFIQETSVTPLEDTRLRGEIDCLLSLYQTQAVDPVREFDKHVRHSPPPPPAEDIALH